MKQVDIIFLCCEYKILMKGTKKKKQRVTNERVVLRFYKFFLPAKLKNCMHILI